MSSFGVSPIFCAAALFHQRNPAFMNAAKEPSLRNETGREERFCVAERNMPTVLHTGGGIWHGSHCPDKERDPSAGEVDLQNLSS